jgi:TP901 family phage tail tape measure protein
MAQRTRALFVEVSADAGKYIAAMRQMATQTQGTSKAVTAMAAAVSRAERAVDRNGQTLDAATRAGRSNQAALDSLARSHLGLIEQADRAGVSTRQLGEIQDQARGQFGRVAQQMGMTEQEAARTADAYGLVGARSSVALASVGRFTSVLQRNSAALGTLSMGLMLGGAAMVAPAGLMVSKWAGFDAEMSEVRAAVGATITDVDRLTTVMGSLADVAQRAGLTTQFSAVEAAQGITSLVKAGLSAADVYNGGLAGALDLTAAGNMSVADTAEFAATAMTQFGLEGEDIPHIADLIAATANKAQGDVSDMAEAMKYVGVQAHQLGWSIEDTSAAIGMLANQGIIGSMAGTALRQMMISLVNPTGEAARLMETYGLSVYDAEGHMVDATELARRLRTSMSGLSEAEKNTAMSTIFGARSIQAATVIADQGAEGMARWRAEVDQAGYASDMARTKTDNLKGDLGRLKSAFEGWFTAAGAGADGPLRSLVQSLTDLVALAGEHPKLTAAFLGLTAALGGAALAVGGVMKATSAILSFIEALKGLNAMSGVFANFGTKLTLGLGAVGIVAALATAGVMAFANSQQRAKERAQTLAQTLDVQTGAWTKNTRAQVANNLMADGALDDARRLGVSLDLVTDAAMGNAAAYEALRAAALRARETDSGQVNVGGVWMNEAKVAWDNLSGAVQTQVGALEDADGEFARNRESNAMLEEAIGDTGSAAARAAQEIETETEAILAQTQAMFDNVSMAISLSGSKDGVYQAISRLKEQLKKGDKGFYDNSDAALANRESLRVLATAMNAAAQEAVDAGVPVETLAQAHADARQAFLDAAVAMGASSEDAEAMAAEFGLAADRVAQLASEVNKIPKTAVVDVQVNTAAAERAINRLIDKDRQLNVTAVAGRADGGRIVGPGTATSDSVLTALSDGEYVIRTASANAVGYDVLSQINATGRLPQRGPTAAAASTVAEVAARPVEVSLSGLMDGASMTLVVDGDRFDARVERVALAADRQRRLAAV